MSEWLTKPQYTYEQEVSSSCLDKIPTRKVRSQLAAQTFPFFLQRRGSITVEAAMVLPVMFMALACFMFFFQVMSIELTMQRVLDGAGENYSSYYHVSTILPDVFAGAQSADEGAGDLTTRIEDYVKNLVVTSFTKQLLKNEILSKIPAAWLDSSCIVGGSSGISTSASIRYSDGVYLVLGAKYTVKLPFVIGQALTMDVNLSSVRRMWTGIERESAKEDEETDADSQQEKETYYKTKYGNVYHIYKDCVSLKRNIKSVTRLGITGIKNQEGKIYGACSLCIHGSRNAIVYVTDSGEKYHNSSTCQVLIRYIEEIEADDTKELPLCSYCEKRKETEDGDK